MTPLLGHDMAVCEFVNSVARLSVAPPYSGIGVIDRGGRLVGGLVYHNWTPEAGTVELSGAAIDRHWLTREVRQLMYDYPFAQMKCQLLIQRNSADNEHLNNQLRRWGYNEFLIPRLYGRDTDGIVFTLTAEQWAAHPRNFRNMKKAA